MIQQKLINLRKELGLSQEELASKVAMEQTTYSRKERGLSLITKTEWDRIAKALDVDIEDIKVEGKINSNNENCTFNGNSIGIQYITIPQEVLDTVLRYNKKLEDEIEELKKKNNS